ncbi:MAG: GreA/GreB family elongation factor [bacterium]|nr:GreA/GreB family elongation factor [bacterium]
MKTIDKTRVLEALRKRIADALDGLTDSQKTTAAGATHEETRAEDPKDTRAVEASYLARGLARRVEALEAEAARLASMTLASFEPDDAVAMTALIEIEDQLSGPSIVFLIPAGAGETLDVDGTMIRPVTPGSPMGRALLGKCAGDDIELELPAGTRHLSISWVV